MASKDRDLEADFENSKPALSQYVDQLNIESKEDIFDDILMVDERYLQSSMINQGGMKKILKTIDSLTGRPVAKATLIDFENSEKVENFLKEARLTAALEHPNIIPVYDIGVDDVEGPFFTMKLVGGQNLWDIIKSLSKGAGETPELPGEKHSLQDLMEIFLKVCDAVAYAHSRAVIHLDLKPENIQIGDFGEVLVCDWGIAKVLEGAENISESAVDLDPCLYNGLTLDGQIKGTPGFMAPEQINTDLGSKSRQTDIYALGGILYSLLCYKAPYESDTLEGVLKETLKGTLALPSEKSANDRHIPASLEAVAMKALQVNPEDRYLSVSELRSEINKWMRGFATDAEDAGFMKSFWLLMKRHKAISVLLFILIISAVFAVSKIKQNEAKALKSAKDTQAAMDLLLKERVEKGEIFDLSLEQLESIHESLQEKYHFESALAIIEKMLVYKPDDKELNLLKAENHFYCQEFKEAIKAFDKATPKLESEVFKKMYRLSKEYSLITAGKEYIPAADLVKLILQFEGEYRDRLFKFEAYKFHFKIIKSYEDIRNNVPRLKNHLEFCRLLINGLNPSEASIDFRYSIEEEGISLDLTGGQNLNESMNYWFHLPLVKLDVRNSDFSRTAVIMNYYLKSLDIRDSKVDSVEIFQMRKRTYFDKTLKVFLTEKQMEPTVKQFASNKIPHWYKITFQVEK